MPKTMPLVSELEWKIVDLNSVQIEGWIFNRSIISAYKSENIWPSNPGPAWFTGSCRQKLLKAMDDFDKAEEPEHWKKVSAPDSFLYAADKFQNQCLLDLRQQIADLKAEVEKLKARGE